MTGPIADHRGLRRRETSGAPWTIPASWIYGFGARVTKALYDSGVLPARRVTLPVVSIGALTVGGSGKTPFVRWLARRLTEEGVAVAILSRGYGGEGGREPRLVDAQDPDARRDGDEPALLARSLPTVPVIVGPDRARSAALASGRGARVLLLDDGFQHRKLYRDLDVVLWDAASADSRGRMLPAGCLREPLSALRRADLLVHVDRGAGAPPKPPIESDATLTALLRPMARQTIAEGTKVHALSGIADPESFEASLASLGLTVTGATRHPDHHAFRPEEIRAAAERAENEGADLLAVTAKDWVRWPTATSGLPVPAVFDLEVEVEGGDALVGRVAGMARDGVAS